MVARRITQETFDATVQENIDEFEMDREEAIADANFRRFLLEVAQACDSHRLTVQGNTHRASIIHGKRRTARAVSPYASGAVPQRSPTFLAALSVTDATSSAAAAPSRSVA